MRRFQFSLRTLFIVVTLICVAMGLYIGPKVRRHNIVRTIEAAGGNVRYAGSSADESRVTKKLREILPQDYFDEITVIKLCKPNVSDATLDGIETFTRLQELYLSDTQVTDATLARLQGLTALQQLWLSGTRVSDAGLAHLEGLTGLEVLRLPGTQVTDAGLIHLRGMVRLRELIVFRTEVSDVGVAELKKFFPKSPVP